VWCWNDPCDHPDHPVQWPWWPLNHHENQHYNIYIYITIIPYINILIYIYRDTNIYIYIPYMVIYTLYFKSSLNHLLNLCLSQPASRILHLHLNRRPWRVRTPLRWFIDDDM
jgi:hypothetical protein